VAQKITIDQAAFRLQRFAFLIDNMILGAMSLTLARAHRTAVTVNMLPQSFTSPVHPTLLTRRTERLAKSVRVDRPRAFGMRFVGALLAGGLNVRYAAIHEYGGTIQHPGSRPVRGQALAWKPKGGGATVFARSTRPHAITIRARPYLRPAVTSSLPFLKDNVERGLARVRSEAGL
jgi:phage gpG-like protein